jgi:hypothetical protein
MSIDTSVSSGDRVPTLLAAPPRLAGRDWSAPLRIPHGHPFFFDHPLDHVSAAITMFGLLDLLAAATGDLLNTAGRRLLGELSFPAICELNPPVMLCVTADEDVPGRWLVRSLQDGTTACDGWLELADQTVSGTGAPGRSLCPRELVHRTRADNVMLGPFPDRDEIVVPMLHPPTGHYLDSFARNGYSVRGAIEASRQLVTLLTHLAMDKPLDTKLVLLELAVNVPCAPNPGTAMALRWRRRPLAGGVVEATFDLISASSAVLGNFRYRVAPVSPAAYRRFRSHTSAGIGSS